VSRAHHRRGVAGAGGVDDRLHLRRRSIEEHAQELVCQIGTARPLQRADLFQDLSIQHHRRRGRGVRPEREQRRGPR
jgi:hypothetical protein